MAIVSGDRYLESLLKFVENNAEQLIEGTLVLKLNPVGLRYVQSRLEALAELESLLSGAPVDYLRAYVSDLGDYRALEQLRRILRLLPCLKVVSVVPSPAREPTLLSFLYFGRLKFLELRGCDLSTSAARGLLELRHTLEKLICHNSTDALRHVFASRIVETKNSPRWPRLTYVSCAFNGLVLMDDSLQLLPLLVTLDISGNKFTKVDNLRKCSKLKHLDLGFNHLRTISYFSEVPCQITSLVLRNNALTTLRGIEHLKYLEGLDASYNMISNFSEIEILAGLPSLQNLWLEGNPLCCARWYREQVFSHFPFPDNLRLDGKKTSLRELWKRQVIVASRQKWPASFGFYSPAIDAAEVKDSTSAKRKKMSRLVSIESENQSTSLWSDQDSFSCDHEAQSKAGNAISDEEGEIVELMNRIEAMKKERSAQWLQDIKEWMDPAAPSFADGRKRSDAAFNCGGEINKRGNTDKEKAESSRYILHTIQASGNNGSYSDSEVDDDSSLDLIAHNIGEDASKSVQGQISGSGRNLHLGITFPGGGRMDGTLSDSYTAIDDVLVSRASSNGPGSPPSYKEYILRRRQNLEEEFLQLSAKSLSAVSSDSNTSCSEDDSSELQSSIPSLIENIAERGGNDCLLGFPLDHVHHGLENNISPLDENGACAFDGDGRHEAASYCNEGSKSGNSPSSSRVRVPAGVNSGTERLETEDVDLLYKREHKRKPKRRIISLSDDSSTSLEPKDMHKSNGNAYNVIDDMKDEGRCCSINANSANDLILNLFHSKFADSGVCESTKEFVRCCCLLQEKSDWVERDVAIFLSSESNFYVLFVGSKGDGPVTDLQLMGCHALGDVSEVLVGLGLQILRICCKETSYLFITRSIQISRKLLHMLDAADSCVVRSNSSLKSLEQLQVDILERDVLGVPKTSILQYSMVLFSHSNLPEDQWLSRSIIVLKRQLLVCKEDIQQIAFLSEDTSLSSYFILDSWCSIVDLSEMVIDTKETQCVTLTLKCRARARAASKLCSLFEASNCLTKGKTSLRFLKWKLKWFCEGSLYNFLALLKALHSEVTSSPLLVTYIT